VGHLLAAELQDRDAVVPRPAVIAASDLSDPQMVSAPQPVKLEFNLRWVVDPLRLEVFDALKSLAGLWELKHGILVVDLVGGVSVRRVQVMLHRR
jgi:hypothetical protein